MTCDEKHFEVINIEDIYRLPKKRLRVPRAAYFFALIIIGVSVVFHGFLAWKLAADIRDNGAMFLLNSAFGAKRTVSMETEKTDEKKARPKATEKPETDDKKDESITKSGDTGALTVITRSLSATVENGVEIWNSTGAEVDINEVLKCAPKRKNLSEIHKKYGDGCPVVLIYHTHGTEAYSDTSANSFRSNDITRNVVAVGDALTEELESFGIGVIHSKEMFDIENWSAAYDKSNAFVRKTLSENPSVCYTLDVHRDCIGNDEAGYTRAVSSFGGADAAQLMFVCGSEYAGSSHTGWRKNLSLDLQLQSLMWEKYPGIMRPVDLRAASFYQDVCDGAMLMEFGTCGGTLEEAKLSAHLFGEVFADYIKNSGA